MEKSYEELQRENDELQMGPKVSEEILAVPRGSREYSYPISGEEFARSIFDQAVEPLVVWANTFGEIIQGLTDEGFRMWECLCGLVSQSGKPFILWDTASWARIEFGLETRENQKESC